MNSRATRATFTLAALSFLTVQAFSQATHDSRIGEIIHSLEQVRNIHETAISPDGSLVAWVVDGANGGTEIDAAPLSNPSQTRRITACAQDTTGREDGLAWSPDSRQLAFFSDCPASQQRAIYLAEPASKVAPRKLAELHGYADSPQWSPDGKYLSFLYVEGATRPSGALAAMKPPSGVIGVEGLEIQRVAVIDPDSGNLSQITPANLHVYEFDWSQDAKKLAYVAAPPPGENNWWAAKLYTQPFMPGSRPIAGGRAGFDPGILVDPQTVSGPLHGLQIAVPRWSPDGSQIAFIGGIMSDQGVTGGDIYIVSTAGGTPVDVTLDRNLSATWLSWRIPEQIEYSAIRSGSSQFRTLVLNSESENIKAHTVLNFEFPATIADGRLEMSLSEFSDDFVFIKSSWDSPPEVWLEKSVDAECQTNCYELKQITHYNDALKPSWGKSESVEWENEGFHVQGWLLYPAHYDPSKKYPMIVSVHGGPSSAVIPHWPSVGYNPAAFSALDYFVLMPNPRGSYGQGEKFTQANVKDFGYGDLRDILAGVDAVEKTHPIDDSRLGLTGWSYGGFMTMFAVTQTHHFRAAVAGAGISNWQSYYGENSIDQWMIPFFGASVYDDPKAYAKSSAIEFIKNVKTPTLVVVGDRDGECPAPQSFEFWHALKAQGVPTELVVYPGEGHHFFAREHQRDVLERALDWFEKQGVGTKQ